MNLTVKKTLSLGGTVLTAGSKSLSIRCLLFSLLAKGESILGNVLSSLDTQTAMHVCEVLGVSIDKSAHLLTVNSNGLPLKLTATEINTGNSGITTVFTLPLLGLREHGAAAVRFDCGEQMRSRPIQPLIYALRDLGMDIQFLEEEGQLPVSVMGQLQGGSVEIDGSNSQYLSALLIALPCALNDSVITVRNLHERPYVNMTLDFLNQQSIAYTHEQNDNMDIFHIRGRQGYTSFQYQIKGDFSSASCLIAAAAMLEGEVELQGLDINDTQGDKKLLSILQQMGADIVIEQEKIRIKGCKPLTGIRIDANDIPDLVPALAVIGTQAAGKTEIYNVSQARIKETDRIHSMMQGLRKMGAKIDEHLEGMTIYQSLLQGAKVNGYDDHRTVMALTVAGLLAEGTTSISDGEAINKTYPEFVNVMRDIGANVTKESESNKHIILIGFKHVGKTRIGRKLASILNKTFIDMDKEVESLYEKEYGDFLTCRQIMQMHGEVIYRELENKALKHVIELHPGVISLGGGTALNQSNQEMISSHNLIHIVAPRGIVFERIMVEGRPAFFNQDEDPYESFTRLWDERSAVYSKLTACTVDNSNTIEQAVTQAITLLNLQSGCSDYV